MTTATESMNEMEAQQQLTYAEDNLTDREEIIQAIGFHKMQLHTLRELLPNAYQTLYCFRCKPQSKVWIYALTRQEAEKKLRQRMNRSYQDSWQVVSQVVQEFDHPEKAAGLTNGNLFEYLSPAEANELLKDWNEDQKGRVPDPNRSKGLKTRLERDIEAYQHFSDLARSPWSN